MVVSDAFEAIDEAAVATVRRLYAALAASDLAAAEACFAPEAVWHVPGHSPIAGTHRGWPEILSGVLDRLGPLSGGTFRAELVDVAVGEHYVVAVQHATAALGQRRLDVTGCQLMRFAGGRIAEVLGHYNDQEALDGFWRGG